MVARRSCLSVPGSSARMLDKARDLAADEVIIDLEDSVAAAVKDQARAAVAAAIAAGAWRAPTVTVRINGPATRWCHRDVLDVVAGAGPRLACLVVPKVEDPGELDFVARLLGMVEQEIGRAAPVALQALIETARGLREIHPIAAAAPGRLQALIAGYADLSASLGRGAAAEGPDDRWHWVQETVLVAARAAGLQAVDGPHLAVRDLDGLRAAAARTRSLGYDGKWALHPAQVEILNEVYAPTREELDRALATLAALEAAEQGEGRGAVMLDGAMIDEASRKLAVQVVARGRAAGLGPAGS